MKPDAPGVFFLDRMPVPRDLPKTGNIAGPRPNRNQRGDVDKGFAEAEVVHEGSYYCPVHTHAPLETHGVVASWEGDQLTIYASTQALFAVREGVAEALGVDRKNVRVLVRAHGRRLRQQARRRRPRAAPSRSSPAGSRRWPGAPVKLMLDRHQEHLCTGNAPSALMTVKVGAKKDGTHHGASLQVVGLGRCRGRRRHRGARRRAPRQEPEPEDRRARRLHERGARGSVARARPLAGRFRARVGDRRARREARPRPARGAARRTRRARSGCRSTTWAPRRSAGSAGTRRPATWRPGAGPSGQGPPPSRVRGLGMANGNWYVFASENSNAQVRVHRDGSVELLTGCPGHRHRLPHRDGDRGGRGARDRPADVTVRLGDTQFPEGPGSGGSTRSTRWPRRCGWPRARRA